MDRVVMQKCKKEDGYTTDSVIKCWWLLFLLPNILDRNYKELTPILSDYLPFKTG